MARVQTGLGRVVIDPQVIELASWETGQVLEVSGDKKTHVRLWPGLVAYGSGMIEMDGETRQNAGAGIGDRVQIQSAEASVAKEIVVSPAEDVHLGGFEGYMVQNYTNRILTAGDTVVVPTLSDRIPLVVVSTKPAGAVVVAEGTQFVLGEPGMQSAQSVFSYDDLGGLDNEIKKIREMVELPLRHPELFEKVGVEAPKGVLLYGPPGTGKTLLAKAVAGETSAHFVHVSGPEIMGKYHGESEERMRHIFKEASENAPSIIFIDEIDSIAPKRDEVVGDVEKRVVSQMLSLMDGLKSRGKVVVIAATNRPDSIDPALRRPGRFDREMEVGIPDEKSRLDILRIHTRGMPLDKDVDLDKVSKVTHGFVGADLAALAKEAAMGSLRRVIPDMDLEQPRISPEILKNIKVVQNDFLHAQREVGPSALREVVVQIPDVRWGDVGGLDGLKEELREATEWPLKYQDAFRRVGAEAPHGILLYGPPGTGKTLIAKALARETDSNFISIKGPELLSKWVGESEKGVREIFRKARQAAPCVIFFDEIDSLTIRRGSDTGTHVTENVVSQILSEMDGLEELHGVMVVGATNRADMIDEALLRPGRFDKVIEVPKPNIVGREQILHIHTKNKPLADGISTKKIAEMTDGYSGAEMRAVANVAAMSALRRHVHDGGDVENISITQQDLEEAIESIRH